MTLMSVTDEQEPEQTEFEGYPVRRPSFELRSTKGLLASRPLSPFEHVGGIWRGWVKGVHHDAQQSGKEESEAALRKTFVIEVLEAEMDAACPHCGGVL